MVAVVATVLALGACSYSGESPGDAGSAEEGSTSDVEARRQPPPKDAGVPHTDASVPVDAAPPGDPGRPGIVSCFSQFDPATTCSTATSHCCFSNYSAAHDGECTASACAWGTISCDGPEDCGTGQHCCAHALIDPNDGMYGYQLACQTAACGPAPVNQELCHPTSSGAAVCGSGHTCVPAAGNDNDLPRALSICK